MFCQNCGLELADDDKFCNQCGFSLGEIAPQERNMNEVFPKSYKLILEREKQFFLINPALRVHISGQPEYKLHSGETITLNLPEGRYNIAAKLSIRNTSTDIILTKDTKIIFRCDRVSGEIVSRIHIL